MDNRNRASLSFVVVGCLAAAQCPGIARAADPNERNVTVRLGEKLTREDNLYRLPAGTEPADLLGGDVRREDVVSSTTAALAARWEQGGQAVVLDTSVAANRFADNPDLDNTSGRGALDWNWRLGGRWSGQTGGRRERSLAGFANSAALEKDVFDTITYHVDTRLDVGPRLLATARARESTTTHDSDARRRDDAQIEAASVGLEYRSPSENSLGLEYRGARATFPGQPLVTAAASASDYEERGASVNLGYVLTDKVSFKGSVGYVERTYELAPRGDFSGDVWNAALTWSPTESTQVSFQRFRELKAHLDAESDHFVSDGEGVTATWFPIDKLGLSVQVSREDQRYIGADVDELVDPTRHDEPLIGGFKVTYLPRERASFEIAYRQETRESNRLRYDYDAAAVSISGEVKF